MRTAADGRRWVIPILVVGLLAVALTLICSEDIHSSLAGTVDGACAIMSHSALAAVVSDPQLAPVLMFQLFALAAGLSVLMLQFTTSARLVAMREAPNPPPDPRFGRTRI